MGMPNLAELIMSRKRELGHTYRKLQELSHDAFTSQRWQQLATGVRIKEFPEPTTVAAIAEALDVDVNRVVLAIARSLGLAVKPAESDLAAMLPASARGLTTEQRHAILAVIKAMNPSGVSSGDPVAADHDHGVTGAAPPESERHRFVAGVTRAAGRSPRSDEDRQRKSRLSPS
jgi:hypothetical protein